MTGGLADDIPKGLSLLLAAASLFILILQIKRRRDRKALIFVAGNLLVGLFCVLDAWVLREGASFNRFVIIGIAAYCVASLTFAIWRLSAIAAERDVALDRLRGAYRDLDATGPLRELGRSAAFVNHEIKNYMMVISGYAALLLRSKNLDAKDRAMADNIAATAAKLHDFNMGVLELFRPETAAGNEEFELAQRLRSCVNVNFAERASDISITCDAPHAVLINGNPEKLERAFINAFRNSFEAGARNVGVRLSVCNQTALITIEDDGAGCGAEQLPNLFTTFFTTKRGAGGTGLGLCVIRSIVESHNGCISIYAKNVLGGGARGLSMQIMIPASKKTPSAAVKTEVMLVKDGLRGLPEIMKMLKNLKVIPRMAERADELGGEWQSSPLDLTIIAAAPKAAELRERTGAAGPAGGGGKINVLPIEETETGALLVVGAANDDGTVSGHELLTEEYIAGCLLKNASAAAGPAETR